MICPICDAVIGDDGVCFGGTSLFIPNETTPFKYHYYGKHELTSSQKQGFTGWGCITGTICQPCYCKYFAHRVGNALQILLNMEATDG